MRTYMIVAAALAVASVSASPAIAADVQTFNSDPSIAFNYGSGNDYLPAYASVLTTSDPTSQISGRAHLYQQPATASTADGTYIFALGSNVSFDYSFANMSTGGFQLINQLTGQQVTYSLPFGGGTLGNSLFQDSQRLAFSFIAGPLGYSNAVNNTYTVNLFGTNAGGSHTNTFFIQLGSGAGAVPEPGTWAMMLVGFGAIGWSMRRTRATAKQRLLQVA
jgi:hypothetical protein